MIILKLLLIAHVIGDFFLQPVRLIEKKKNSMKAMIAHAVVYTLVFWFALLLFANLKELLLWSLVTFVVHLLIDILRGKLAKKYDNNAFAFWSFIASQLLHVVLIVVISYVVKSKFNSLGSAFNKLLIIKELGFVNIINYGLAFLLILKPASVFINYLLNLLNKEKTSEPDKISSLIGMFERVAMLLFGIFGSYGAIALVLVSKTIIKFKQFDDKKATQMYLVGSFASVIIALIALLII